jgi:branched-chain amino acid transport system substrate-binding protein
LKQRHSKKEDLHMKRLAQTAFCAAIAVGLSLASPAGAQTPPPKEQYLPVTSYRIGPYAANGTSLYGGYIDYLHLLDVRDGGINGVKLVWDECETEYKVDKGVECYERMKKNGPTGASMFHFYSTALAYALLDRAGADKVPLVTIAHGRTDSSDGRVFPYVFPLVTNYWSLNTDIVKFIGMRLGGMDKLKGKKIVHLYLDVPYGKEPNEIFQKQAAIYGFEAKLVPVPAPGTEQQAQWLEIRQFAPDWVIVTGYGVMNPAMLKAAARVNFPRDHLVGNFWTGSEEDTVPAGEAAVGYIAAAINPAGTDFKVIEEIEKYLYAKGLGNMTDKARVGTVLYNRGVMTGIISAEAIRTAQGKYGKKPLTGEEIRWGLENLNLDAKRIAELGATGLIQPLKVSCADHEGGGAAKFQQWDGKKWKIISDWIQPDRKLVREMIEASSAAYAKEKGITPRDCSKGG